MAKKKSHKRLSRRTAIYTPTSGTTVLINYSEDSLILEVEFRENNKVYHYLDLELEKWEEYKAWIEEGRSSGTFVNKYIKPFYEAEELDT
ncbi:MAG: KTSC domain-containing protein [Chitinophagaceae bacterium]